MSNRLFQGIVHQMKDAIDRTIGVIDETSVVIACSELGKIGEVNESVNSETLSSTAPFVINGYTYKSFGSNAKYDYAVFVQGTDEYAQKYAQLLSVSFASIKQYYDEKYDRSNFIKNVILDNILPGDIYLKARELHFNSEVSRVCLLIKIVSKTDVSAYDIIQNLFPDKSKDFVININEYEIALVKEIKADTESRDLEKLASSISDTLSSEFYTHCVVGIGTTVTGIKDLARSFKEAQSALEVAKVFDTERTIVSYDNLGIARLIYQLPTTLCEMFLKEVFKRGSIESLDQETLFTIQRFFENNLNVSASGQHAVVVQAALDGCAHRLPDRVEVVPDFGTFAVAHILPEGLALVVAPLLDLRNGRQRVDAPGRFEARGLVGQRPAADAVNGPGIDDFVAFQPFEQHAVGVEGEHDLRFPDTLPFW